MSPCNCDRCREESGHGANWSFQRKLPKGGIIKLTLEEKQEEVEEGRIFQAERLACAKPLWQEGTRSISRARGPEMMTSIMSKSNNPERLRVELKKRRSFN